MAYYSGSANDMTAVRSALIDVCVAEGWLWDSSEQVLSKNQLFMNIKIEADYLCIVGRTSAGAGETPNAVRIGRIGSVEITWPVVWEVFVFEDEVYLIINYGIDFYQWAAFGLSKVMEVPGTGAWCAATGGGIAHVSNNLNITPVGGGTAGTSGQTCGAPFWASISTSTSARNSFVHHNLDGRGWSLAAADGSSYVGVLALSPLIALQPNNWNSEAVLLPVRAYITRESGKVSLVNELDNARYIRLDNYIPGQIVSLGSSSWKVFPFYRKNSILRDGGSNVAHSGTLGWAIRYEGP